MRGVDEPYQEWERLPSFETKDGRAVHLMYAPAYGGQPEAIWAFDQEVDPGNPDLEYSLARDHRVGLLRWTRSRIDYLATGREVPRAGEPSWEGQGVATLMYRLARDIHPDLIHAPCRERTKDGEAFVRATSPGQACANICGQGCRQRGPKPPKPEPESVRPHSLLNKIMRKVRGR